MEIDKQELAKLAGEELLRRLDAGTLSPEAQAVVRAELAARGVAEALPAAQKAADEGASEAASPVESPPTPRWIDLVTLLRTNDVMKANVLRLLLESEGTFAFVWGEHMGIAHIIYSAATGGMRLQVRNDQLIGARAVLIAFESGQYALDEYAFDEAAQPCE